MRDIISQFAEKTGTPQIAAFSSPKSFAARPPKKPASRRVTRSDSLEPATLLALSAHLDPIDFQLERTSLPVAQ